MEIAMTSKASLAKDRVTRDDRLGFRLDEQTKGLIERAALLERRKISDYCLTAITDAARPRRTSGWRALLPSMAAASAHDRWRLDLTLSPI
jgi:hypothetical protein